MTLSRRLLAGFLLPLLGAIGLLLAAYHGMYHLFLVGQGLETLAVDRSQRAVDHFRFDGVQWFRGTRLASDGAAQTAFTLRTIGAIDRADNELEIFVRVEPLEESTVLAGTLRVEHAWWDRHQAHELPLTNERLQRFTIPWPTASPWRRSQLELADNVTSFELVADTDEPLQAFVATRLRGSLLPETLLWSLLGSAALIGWSLLTGRGRGPAARLIVYTIVLLAVLRGGALISNDFFLTESGEASTFITSFSHTRHAIGAGSWYDHAYKRTMTFAVPAICAAIQPAGLAMDPEHYIYTFPTPRLVWFLLELTGVCLLAAAARQTLSAPVAYVYPLLHGTFVPFMFNIYNMEDDALLLLLMLPLTALLLVAAARPRLRRADFAWFAVLAALFTLSKITGSFLFLLIPAGLYLGHRLRGRGADLKQAAVLQTLLIGTVLGANTLNKVLPPNTGEAQPGYAYHGQPLWDMLWAANGLWDRETAHPFIKVGRERDRIVGEAAGLPPERHRRLRHSAIGDELVYKPQLAAAWRQRPGFFLNNMLKRFWAHGLMFYGYPDRGRYFRLDAPVSRPIADGERWEGPVTGKDARRLGTIVERARYDEVWKVAAPVLITSLLNFDQPGDQRVNLLLTIAAVLGILLMRRPGLAFIFVASLGVKLAFNTAIHGKTRYLDFVHVPMLLGLAVLIVVAWGAVRGSKPS